MTEASSDDTRIGRVTMVSAQVFSLLQSTEGLTIGDTWQVLNYIQSSLLVQGLLDHTLTLASVGPFVAWQCERMANVALATYQQMNESLPNHETKH